MTLIKVHRNLVERISKINMNVLKHRKCNAIAGPIGFQIFRKMQNRCFRCFLFVFYIFFEKIYAREEDEWGEEVEEALYEFSVRKLG